MANNKPPEDFDELDRVPASSLPPGYDPSNPAVVAQSRSEGAYPFDDPRPPVPPRPVTPQVSRNLQSDQPYDAGRPDHAQGMTPRPAPHQPQYSEFQEHGMHPAMRPQPMSQAPQMGAYYPQAPMQPQVTMRAYNPLQEHFRTPAMHVILPSRGKFMNPGELELSMTEELAVYPMTAADELMLKNPDSLLNGHALEHVIRSCMPGIHNPRNVSSPDLDVILLAIRSATYGDEMSVGAKCPSCSHDNEFEVSVKSLLSTTQYLEETYAVTLKPGLIAYMKPYNLEASTRSNIAQFEETRRLAELNNIEDLSEEVRLREYNASYDRINTLNLELIARSIIAITTPDGQTVQEPAFLIEFVQKTDRNTVAKLDDVLRDLGKVGVDKAISVQCSNCHHEWQTEVEFDATRFFV